MDHPRSSSARRVARQPLELSRELAEALQELSSQEGVTLFVTLLAAFKTLLHRYTGQEDILVGAPVAGIRAGGQGSSRSFADPLVLRTNLSGNPTFRQLLRQIQGVTSLALARQSSSPGRFIETLRSSWGLNYPPLFQVMFALVDGPEQSIEPAPWTPGLRPAGHWTAGVDLSLFLREKAGGLGGFLEYNAELFDEATICRLSGHFRTVVGAIAADPDARIAMLPMLTAAEYQQLLVEWNATHQAYPSDQCLQHLVEAQVGRTPDAPAIVCEDQRLTYRKLNARANQLAHYLRKHGVGPEVLVGLCVERVAEMVVGQLGILKAGGAYVPLDPGYPKERLAFMIEDAQIGILLTHQRHVPSLPERTGKVVCLDADWDAIAQESEENPDTPVAPDNLAYVIYTSGSTGKPKGVEVLHRGVVNFLASVRDRPGLTAEDTLLAVTTISFDIAVLELFLPLTIGARVVLISQEAAKDGQLLRQILVNSGATVMQATPATWRLLLEAGWPGSPQLTILCGGEALSWELAAQLLPKARAVWNLYGPTETTIWSTIHPVSANDRPIPIGRPIANTEIYMLDPSLFPVPVGVVGELYIGGAGVARGYLNRPELTAERFIPHPFRNDRGARLYRTGDMARYRPDGTIEFLGRSDTQVKLRGFRIELGEIESVLAQHPAVREAAVVVREEPSGDQRLVAYAVRAQRPAPTARELRHFLLEQMPDYMVPTTFVWLDALPLTPNGKVDRKALPAPQPTAGGPQTSFVAPQDNLEAHLSRLWEKALGTKPIGVEDDFFELGGHSLLAVRLCEQIERRFGKNLSPATLFQAPTIRQLARLLRQETRVAPSWSLVVPLRPSGARPAFFCVFSSPALARRMSPDQPFFALQPRGLAGRRAPATIEAAAEEILREIRALQPEGPYFIGGFSFSGLVAFEMAQQLTRERQKVALLALIDPHPLSEDEYAPPTDPNARRSPVSVVRRKIAFHARALSNRGPCEQLAYIAEGANRHLGEMRRRMMKIVCRLCLALGRRLPFGLRLFYFHETSRRASRQYVPRVYPGHAILFRTPHTAPRLESEWSKLIGGGLEVHEVPGQHLDIMREPHVRSLATKLGVCLAQAQAAGRGKGSLQRMLSLLACVSQVTGYG